MRSSQHNQRLSVVDRSLLLLCAMSTTLFLMFWIGSDHHDLRGWLWGALTQESERSLGGVMRVVLELSLLGLSLGLCSLVALRRLSARRHVSHPVDGDGERSAIHLAEVGYSTRIDLVARAIAMFECESPFDHLSIIGEVDGRCGVEWHHTPLFSVPDGWTMASPTTWFLIEATVFDTADFPFSMLVSMGAASSGREYFIDVMDVGGIGFVGPRSSIARDVLLERWETSPWNRAKVASGFLAIETGLVSEVPNDVKGLTIDVEIEGSWSVWSPRGRPWQVRHQFCDDESTSVSTLEGAVTLEEAAAMCAEETEGCPDEQSVDLPARYSFMVRVLGEVAVQSADGESVVFERGRSQELLAWLVTHDERPTRSAAKSAIWDVAVRPTTFANVVSDIRRTLSRSYSGAASSDWIERETGDSLVIDDQVVSDAAVLRDAVQRSLGLPPTEVISCLRWPVSLLRGLPFQGTTYRWPDPEGLTSELVMLSMSASTALAKAYLEVADLQGVMWATGQGLRVLPGDEELIALRMRARGRQGDVAALRQEWDSYERVLADEWLGGRPSPRLQSLRRELLDDRSR